MHDLAHLLQCDEIIHAHLVGDEINSHLCDIDRPRVSTVGITLILALVPMYAGRRAVLAERFERTVTLDVRATGPLPIRRRILSCEQAHMLKRLAQAECGRFDELADDHRSARGDRGAAV